VIKIELKPVKIWGSILGVKVACLNELFAFVMVDSRVVLGVLSGIMSDINRSFAQRKLNCNKHIRGLLIAEVF